MLDIYKLTNFYYEIIIKFTIYFNKELSSKIDKISNIEYAYIKGLNLLKNIVNMNLLYLDDLNELLNVLEKKYIYYVEFLNQIYASKVTDNFELTIKDAIIFCYRKDIINNKIKETRMIPRDDLNKINLLLDLLNILMITVNCNYEYIMLNNFETNSSKNYNPNIFFYEKIIFINKMIKKIMQILFLNKTANKTLDNKIINNMYEFFNCLYHSIDYNYINKLAQSEIELYYINLYKLIDNYLLKKEYLNENTEIVINIY